MIGHNPLDPNGAVAQSITNRVVSSNPSRPNGKATTVHLIANILECQGMRVGMTITDGIYVEGQRIDTGVTAAARRVQGKTSAQLSRLYAYEL